MRYEPRSSKSGAGTFLNKQNLAHEKSNTELLQEIEDTLRSGTVEDMDTDKIEYYLSILQERAPIEEDYDPEQQWSELREAHPLIFSVEDTPSEKKRKYHRLSPLRTVRLALACVTRWGGLWLQWWSVLWLRRMRCVSTLYSPLSHGPKV